MYSLGKKVKLLRKEVGLKQEDLTCDILSRTMLSKIENDKVTPSIYQLNHISKKLGYSVDYFLQNGVYLIQAIRNTKIQYINYLKTRTIYL